MKYSGAYQEYGDRRNPSIVFVHGIRLGRAIWEQHAMALADRYHVVTVDLPGHGALAATEFSTGVLYELLTEVVTHVCAAPPLLVGYSLGGYVIMDYARRYPERTRALLLMGCTLDMTGWRHWPYEVSARFSQIVPHALLARIGYVMLHLVLPRPVAGRVAAIPFNHDVVAHSNRLVRGAEPFSRRVRGYPHPVLIVNGEYDLAFRLDERRFLKALPQARLHVIRNADHNAPLRHPAKFTRIVADFAAQAFQDERPPRV